MRPFYYLQELHLNDNHLTGRLPQWLAKLQHLRSLRLHSNRFEYEDPVYGSSCIDDLYVRCSNGSITTCDGVPPTSCSAFFPLRRSARTTATRVSHVTSISLSHPVTGGPCGPTLLGAKALFCVAIVRANAHSRRTHRPPRHLHRWVAGVSVLITHAQTLAMVGDLRLAWPDGVRQMSALLTADVTWLLPPECTHQRIGRGIDRSSLVWTQLFNGLAIVVVQSILLLSRALVVALSRKNTHHVLVDRVDLIRNTFHAIAFGVSLRNFGRLLMPEPLDDLDSMDEETVLLLKYCFAALVLIVNLASWYTDMRRARERDAILAGCAERLEWSAYLKQRFAVSALKPYASSWQDVIFLQQLSLGLFAAIVDVLGPRLVPVLVHGLAGLLSLLAIWWAQNQLQPYEYTFMNVTASVLYLCSLLLLSCGLLHETIMRTDLDTEQLKWLWALEAAMVPTVGTITIGATVYLLWGLLTSRRPSEQVDEGTYVSLSAEISPLRGRAATYLKLPRNAVAIENVAHVQSEARSSKSGGVRFPMPASCMIACAHTPRRRRRRHRTRTCTRMEPQKSATTSLRHLTLSSQSAA